MIENSLKRFIKIDNVYNTFIYLILIKTDDTNEVMLIEKLSTCDGRRYYFLQTFFLGLGLPR